MGYVIHPRREAIFPPKESGLTEVRERISEPPDRVKVDWLQKVFFDGTSRLTQRFPRTGSRFLDVTLRPIAGSHLLSAIFLRHNQSVVRGLESLRRFLVIPDIHIGDAIMSQSAITALRDYFPEARVDYAVNKTAFPLIEGNPEATRVVPLFSGGSFPTFGNLEALRQMIAVRHYDLVLNFCPYIKTGDLALNGTGILNFMSQAPVIVRNERRSRPINHFIYQTYRFTHDLLAEVARPVRNIRFRGVSLSVSDSAIDEARRFVSEAGLRTDLPLILFNPDAASIFTLMPFKQQAQLLERLVRLRAVILVGEGITETGLGERLKASLPSQLMSRVTIVPSELSLEAYAALIDLCDVFISADTGPLHIAAAWRASCTGRHLFRNRTAVLSYFGATPARMSGYDSHRPGYLPANQDAPSWAYTAKSPCRNITCLNKMYKTCHPIRCFERVDINGLVGWIRSYLNCQSRKPVPRHDLRAA